VADVAYGAVNIAMEYRISKARCRSGMIAPTGCPGTIYHHKCDPHHERGDYWLPVSDANTYKALLHWCAHLFSKRWLHFTDWDEFIYHVFRTNGDFP